MIVLNDMVVIVLTNGQMGVHCVEKNGVRTSNYHKNLYLSSEFSIFRRPVFGVTLKTVTLKESGSLFVRMNKCEAISVSSKGGSVTELGDGGIIKEFEFKRSFDDYLKAMESVKNDREKKKGRRSNMQKLRNDSRGKNGSSPTVRDVEHERFSDFEGQVVHKKSKQPKQYDLYKTSQKGPTSDAFNRKETVRKRLKDGRNIRFEDSGKAKNARERDGREHSEREAREKGSFEKETENWNWTNQTSSRVQGILATNDSFRAAKPGLIISKSSGGFERDGVQGRSKLIHERRSDAELVMERAAFKVIKEYDDVIDKPRVSRVDMEDRIQKLAKSLNGADIHMPEWMFSKMMRSAQIRFSDHSILRVIQILGKLGNWRRVLQVIEWTQSHDRFKSHKQRYIFTAALDALGKAKRPVEALNLFRTMQQQMSSYPDIVAYRCIAVTLGQAGHMKELFDVIDSMRSPPRKKFKTGVVEKWDPRLEPDIVVYNAVLNACVRRKKWEGAFWVLQQLKEQGLQPSSTTYGLVMEVMFTCERYNLVHDFFRKVQKTSIPNALTYKVFMNTLWKEGKIDEAVLVVQEMERRGVVGTAALYYDLARCLCSAGRCQEALIQIDKICKVASKPLVVTYTGLIQACLDSGDIQNGEQIFNHMQKFCSPNLVTFNIMLKAYVDNGMFKEAKFLFQKLLLQNDDNINKRPEYSDRLKPDIYSFNLMLDACGVERNWDDLEFFFNQMLQHGYHFNAKRHLRLILDACRAGKGELLETAWKHLVDAERVPPPLLVREMFRVKLEQDNFGGALSCFVGHSWDASSSQVYSPKSWTSFFKDNMQIFRKATLVRLMEEVNEFVARSDSPNLIILQNLGRSCRDLLRKKETLVEFNQTETFAGL